LGTKSRRKTTNPWWNVNKYFKVMVLIRFILISLIIYLIVRSFAKLGETDQSATHKSGPESSNNINTKGVSKKIGEYIDYEEVDKKQ
jgi:large-conductance mechanosensitive channel